MDTTSASELREHMRWNIALPVAFARHARAVARAEAASVLWAFAKPREKIREKIGVVELARV